MASSLPIPAPPRTPTPPTPIPESNDTFEINGANHMVNSSISFDTNALSPMTATFPFNSFGSMGSPMASSTGTPVLASEATMGPPAGGQRSPFNFQTQTIKDLPTTANSSMNVGKRRGHRYKHSSISTQFQTFQQPPQRAPLALPASLPIPTMYEAYRSLTRSQRSRLLWCLCHFLAALYVLYSSDGSLALTALSHLIFFDAMSATICVGIDVLGNFEVWRRSSIRHPFGLQRTEVLAGFAMSVFLLFMGFDLISHNLKHVLEGLGKHQPHHPHSHQRVSPGSVDSAALVSIIATLISAIGLKNHARIGKAMRLHYFSSLPSILSNPSHLLTLSCSTIMLLLPLLSLTIYIWLDRLLCTVISLSMFGLGIKLAITQGLILLLSSTKPPAQTDAILSEIKSDPLVCEVLESRFWQVHFGVCMACLKIMVKGSSSETRLKALREKITMLVRNGLGGGYGKGEGVMWEVTVEFVECDPLSLLPVGRQ